MTEIKTAQAWLAWTPRGNVYKTSGPIGDSSTDTVVIVHGMTEPDVHEAAAMLENSKEVCEWCFGGGEWLPPAKCSMQAIFLGDAPNFCPSCGRKVVVK